MTNFILWDLHEPPASLLRPANVPFEVAKNKNEIKLCQVEKKKVGQVCQTRLKIRDLIRL